MYSSKHIMHRYMGIPSTIRRCVKSEYLYQGILHLKKQMGDYERNIRGLFVVHITISSLSINSYYSITNVLSDEHIDCHKFIRYHHVTDMLVYLACEVLSDKNNFDKINASVNAIYSTTD